MSLSDYIANPIKKVLSVRIYLPAGTFRGGSVKKPPYIYRYIYLSFDLVITLPTGLNGQL